MIRFFLLIRNWIVYILLAGAAVFFGYQTLRVWSADDSPKGESPVRKPRKPPSAKRTPYRRAPHYKTYEVIPQKNLFASDRMEKLDQAPEPAPSDTPPKTLGNKLALFGIVINGDEKKALVSDFDKKRAKEDKEHIWVTVGDKIGNFEVTEINLEELIITQGDSAYAVRLSDQSHPEKKAILKRSSKRLKGRMRQEQRMVLKNLPKRTAASDKKSKKSKDKNLKAK